MISSASALEIKGSTLGALLLCLFAGCTGESAPSPPTGRVQSSPPVVADVVVDASAGGLLGEPPASIRRWNFERELMGTRFRITLIGGKSAKASRSAARAFAEVARVEARISTWQPSSELSALNQRAGGEPVSLSSESLSLLREAVSLAALSNGAFDPTWAAFKGLWDFRRELLPRQHELHAARALVGHQGLELDIQRRTGRLSRRGMAIDLGGIGKGYAIDRAVLALRMAGWKNFSVDGGGDLYLSGRPAPERRWQIGIRHPRRSGEVLFTLSLENQAIATSGDYERFFIKDGIRFHHIIDLRSGYPAQGAVSVTVTGARAVLVDAWATALMVLGPREGLPLIQRQSGFEAALLAREGEIHTTPQLRESLPRRWRPLSVP